MQNQSKNKEAVIYLPYSFTPGYPFFEWGDQKYSPPCGNNRLHRHNCMEIGYCYEGSGIFLEGSRSASFTRGDVSIVWAERPHIACSNSGDMSQSTLRRYFKRVTGLAPMDFLYDARIKLAAALLREEGCRITDVAEAAGYSSISSFNRHFKQYMGMCPTEYRNSIIAYDIQKSNSIAKIKWLLTGCILYMAHNPWKLNLLWCLYSPTCFSV